MKRTLRLAVLECDIPMPHVAAKCGSYGDMFDKLLRTGLKSLNPGQEPIELQVKKFDVVDGSEYPDPDTVDGILLTGSKHTAYDNDPWIMTLVQYVYRIYTSSQVPIVGICFGHQLVARALGANVGLNPYGWETAVGDFQLTELGTRIFGKSSLSLQQMHRDAVLSLPLKVQSLGSNSCCDIQGFYEPHRLLTLQGHPEFDRWIMDQILDLRHGLGLFNDEEHRDGLSRSGLSHDSDVVGRSICKFLLRSDP